MPELAPVPILKVVSRAAGWAKDKLQMRIPVASAMERKCFVIAVVFQRAFDITEDKQYVSNISQNAVISSLENFSVETCFAKVLPEESQYAKKGKSIAFSLAGDCKTFGKLFCRPKNFPKVAKEMHGCYCAFHVLPCCYFYSPDQNFCKVAASQKFALEYNYYGRRKEVSRNG